MPSLAEIDLVDKLNRGKSKKKKKFKRLLKEQDDMESESSNESQHGRDMSFSPSRKKRSGVNSRSKSK